MAKSNRITRDKRLANLFADKQLSEWERLRFAYETAKASQQGHWQRVLDPIQERVSNIEADLMRGLPTLNGPVAQALIKLSGNAVPEYGRESDRAENLAKKEAEAKAALLCHPAPDRAALLYKLEICTSGDEEMEAFGEEAKAIIEDARRLLAEEAGQ
jgi:hypothetical protein